METPAAGSTETAHAPSSMPRAATSERAEIAPVFDAPAVGLDEIRRRLKDRPLFEWLLENYYLPKTRRPYSFRGHAYLIGIAKDTHPNVAIEKSAQAAISEIGVAKSLHVVDVLGLNAVFAMPAMEQMRLFSHGRVRRVIDGSPYLRSRVSGVTNVSQKEIGHGILYLIGSQDTRQIITIDADFLLIDELDRHLQENVTELEQRVEHSELKWIQYQSTPTVPEFGIDQLYLESDCREWHIKCERCGEWQTLRWEENVVELPAPHVVCKRCREEIDRLAMGEWVVKFPSRSDDVHGYHINKLFCERANIPALWKRSKSIRHEKQFYQSDLGRPWVPKGGKITLDQILAIATLDDPPAQPDNSWLTIGGVDVGPNELYVGIDKVGVNLNRRALVRERVECSTTEAFEILDRMFRHWKVRCGVIDAQPEERLVKEFCERPWGGRAKMWRAYFHNITEEYRENERENIIQVNRTMACDAMVASYRSGELIRLPQRIISNTDYVSQMQAPVRQTYDPNTQGVGGSREARETRSIWVKTTKPDHFFFVETYLWLALNLAPPAVKTIYGRL